MELKDIIIVIPSYEPDGNLPCLIEKLAQIPFLGILIIDDGSGDMFNAFFEECKQYTNCKILTHDKNMGKGSSLKTGFDYILKNIPDCKGVITADSDGQHTPGDIKKIAEELCKNSSGLIIGSRNCLKKHVPIKSRIGNVITRNIFSFFSGSRIKDTQSGLRGFSRENIQSFLKIKGERYNYEMYMLMECRALGIKIFEIPIETVYINGNKSSHFNPLRDSLSISFIFLKFISSSLIAALVDFVVFYIMQEQKFSLEISVAAARLISSFINFIINKSIVFKNKKNVLKAVFKYYFLVVLIGILSYLSICLLTSLGMNVMLAKLIADTLLFLLSYYFQKVFVF